MSRRVHDRLSRRERQIMEVLFRLGQASAAEVHAELPDPPSRTAVRTFLRILEDKGQVKHKQDGPRYVYLPRAPKERGAPRAGHQLSRKRRRESRSRTLDQEAAHDHRR